VAGSGDVQVFRSLARATINSSLDAVNPLSLKPSERLLLAMSPHVLVPDALEKEEQYAAELQLQLLLHQGSRCSLDEAQLQQQQQQLGAAPSPAGQHCSDEQQPLLRGLGEAVDENHQQHNVLARVAAPDSSSSSSDGGSQQQTPTAASLSAAVTASFADPLTSSAVCNAGEDDSRSGAPELEPVFTDPLRRQTWPGDDSSDEQVAAGDEEGAGTDDQLQHQAVTALRLPPLWLQGLKLYDR
jgi:hypothetical protein